MQHPGIDTIGASLQLEFGFIKVTSIRSLERTVRLCRRQHIDGRRLHGDALSPSGAVYIVYSSGPSTEHCGTPQINRRLVDRTLPMRRI